ncbi:cancer-associated gene 1 protein homolog [Mizuhopecten yessoensis]|uniref:cancer-associated gene 1 protein homolog n=1 Tax=Mizuhopecten yessoensis TaxID=6573 RepID=UPI000B45927E|nr:cancer-associated gene 1 protein homolog [Mizuhopecten yessoensis]
MVKLLLQEVTSDISKTITSENDKVLKELRDIKEAQVIGQRDIAGFKKDRETDRAMYAQLQDQYMKLKQKYEDTTIRLKDLNKEKCALARNLGKLETDQNSSQQEVKILKERQSSDAEKFLSEIQCREKEIESLRKRISELEGIIASSKETHQEDSVQIRDLNEKIETLKEQKGAVEKMNNELSKEVEELKEHSVSPTNGLPSWRHDMQSGRELTVYSKETKRISESPRLPRQSDMGMPRLGPKPFHTPGAYNTPRQQAFVGTGPSTASHNIVHKKGQKFASREYRK